MNDGPYNKVIASAVRAAILTMGVPAFKQTSLFMSSHKGKE